jgi:hypothetical protein
VAVDDEAGELLGSVTTPKPGEALTPLAQAGEFDFRLLAVDPGARSCLSRMRKISPAAGVSG